METHRKTKNCVRVKRFAAVKQKYEDVGTDEQQKGIWEFRDKWDNIGQASVTR